MAETNLVLVVDDIEENLKVLSETLTQAGFHPLQARSGERALQIAAKAKPDLILLDIKMPGMDGFETIARLRAEPATADIPVIFISALNQIEDKVQGFRAGAVDYVSKPFQREEVVARVGTHLRLRDAQRKTERLLEALLPAAVANELRDRGEVEPTSYPAASVLFADLVDFTGAAAGMSPRGLIAELNDMTGAFDTIMHEHGCERIKTIGDAYLAVSGMPEPNPDHALSLTRAGLAMVAFLESRNARGGVVWRMRVGVHSGEVVAGIVGTRRYIYDVFGDTVNIASRMESASEPMRVNVSAATRALIGDRLGFEARGSLPVKGQGPMEMSFARS